MPLLINEFVLNHTGSDTNEYVEILGDPLSDYSNYTLLEIEGDGTAAGTIDGIYTLGSTDSDGYWFTGFLNNELENGTLSLLLVRDFSGSAGDDLDTDDDGILDAQPWAEIIDAVGVSDGGAGDRIYADVVLAADFDGGIFTVGGASRIPNGEDTGSTADWVRNDFELAGISGFTGSLASGEALNTPNSANRALLAITIPEIQGAGHVSAYVGQQVITQGIVTAVDNNGFYLQDSAGDGDDATSDALFVFTGSSPAVTVSPGDLLQVQATVSEFTPGGAATGNLSTTQLSSVVEINIRSSGNALPAPVLLGGSGRIPPSSTIDDDAFTSFDPGSDGIDFFESLEGMLVTAQDLVAVAGTNRFGEIFAVVDQGKDATGISQRGTLNLSPDDFNPEKIQIDADPDISGFEVPSVDVGDLLGDVTGVIGYSFGNFEIIPTVDFSGEVVTTGLAPETADFGGTEEQLTVASYNVLNLDINDGDGDTDVADGRFTAIADQVVNSLFSPDIIGLQEIQDDSGSFDDGITIASATLQALADEISRVGGPAYEFIDNTFITNNASGGQPGANIRTAFLYNPNRVSLVSGSVQTIGSQASGEAFFDARLPLVASFTFNGQEVTVVNNHFSSKGGSAPILGVEQPFEARQEEISVNGSLDERQAQSAAIQGYVTGLLTDEPTAKIVVLGDFNEFEFVSPLTGLEAVGLVNLTNTLPEDERYSFIFQGNSQSLDHILISESLRDGAQFDIVHVNVEFAETAQRASDHDPLLVGLSLEAPTAPQFFTLELLHIADQEAGAAAIQDAPRLSAVLNALRQQDLGNDGLPDNTLTLSSGDAFIPGLFYDASAAVFGSGGIGDIQIQNELGIQAIAFGNHEFDFGTGTLAGLIDGSAPGDFSALVGSTLAGLDFSGTAFPYLSTNLDVSTDTNLASLAVAGGGAPQANSITSSVVIDVNGEPIGVIGATTPTLGIISSPGDVTISPADFDASPTSAQLDALAAEIQAEVDALLAANTGLNKVVLLAHMQQLDIERALAQRLENVDIIVGGGSNTRLFDGNDRLRAGDSNQGTYPEFIVNGGGTTTALVNTDGSYKYVGRLVLDFDADGNILPTSYDPVVSGAYATDAQGVADLNAAALVDPEIQAIVDAIEAQILATEGNVFGISEVFLNGNRSGTDAPGDPDGVRTQETNLGNLTADANLAIAKQADPTVVVSIKNGGGIRASIGQVLVPAGGSEAVRLPNEAVFDSDGNLVKPEGGISQNDIQTTLAFNNGLSLLTLTKAELVAVLEHGVGAIPGVSGRFPQVSGVRFSYDPDLAPGDRLVNAAIVDETTDTVIAELVRGGELVGDPDETFRIVTLNFLAGGGDGYPFPTGSGADRLDLYDLDADGVADGALRGLATFAADGTEQDALAEYLASFFPADEDPNTPVYGEAEQGRNLDERIQNLNVREDAVFPVVVIPGTGGGDNLEGTEGDDIIDGGEGPDRLFGNAGDDLLIGGEGPDRIDGGPGDDIIDGGSGPSKLTGGEGSDTFVLNPGPGFARISDFEVGTDRLALPSMDNLRITSGSSFEDLDVRISGNARAGARIRFGSDLVAVLEGVDPKDLKDAMQMGELFTPTDSFLTMPPDVLA